MAACSPYFRELYFTEDGVEKKDSSKEVVLEDVDPTIMDMIVNYLYSADIEITDENVQDVFAVANRFQIPSVFTVCVNYLQNKLSLANCLAVFRMGLVLNCPRLAVSARDFIAERFEILSKDEDFLEFQRSELFATSGAMP
ncbi:hypothetical protein QQF64_034672 [Cirrhinus molitorella]|uniref:BTB domain-containing protein n=1 Tax=Cirrhinus molitorella TaxID=172907 RepID=A0ABR3L620_9TELE